MKIVPWPTGMRRVNLPLTFDIVPYARQRERESGSVPIEEESDGTRRSGSRTSNGTSHEAGRQQKREDEDRDNEAGQTNYQNIWSRCQQHLREPLAEFLGTAIALLVGECAILSVIASNDQAETYQSTNWAWGFGYMLGVYVAGGISGAHLNPALSIMLSVWRGFPWHQCALYVVAQLLGAITGAGLAYAIYTDAIEHAGGGILFRELTPQFITQPKPWVSLGIAFLTEGVASGVLGCMILALTDSNNSPPGAGMHALIVGLLVTTVSISMSYNTGGCFNPVRDNGPRPVALMAGFGAEETFLSSSGWWSWGAWGATVSGAIIGGSIYDICVFVGGESPVNYTRDKRRQSMKKWQIKCWGRNKRSEDTAQDCEKQKSGSGSKS